MPVSYPVCVSVPEPERLSRWQVLFKWWLFVIPHLVVLILLWTAMFFATVGAFFAILFTSRYPQSLFSFAVGVQRWGFRVGAYMLLLRDEYPPFSFSGAHPAAFVAEYSGDLSRGLVLVKWWLLAIPHYFVLAALDNVTLLLALCNGVVILFTGRPHSVLFGLIRGSLCWAARVGAYATLLTDHYPPFGFEESTSAAESTVGAS